MNNKTKNCDKESLKDKKDGKVKNTIELNPPIKESFFEHIINYLNEVDKTGLEEGLTVAQRVKRASNMKRREPQLEVARRRALAKRAEKSRLEHRSRRDAIERVKSKYSGGQKTSDMSYADKARVEDILKTKKGAVAALSKKLIGKARERDNARQSFHSINKENK